ncbi:MAG TPA: S-layer homology domain-containing protein [Thermoanaerobaculia bacterium]|jgi:hypothetical protein
MRRTLVFSILFVVAAGFAAADESASNGAGRATPAAGDSPETYGTTSLTVFTISSSNFTPRNSADEYVSGIGIERYLVSFNGRLRASPMLPNGSQIEQVELRACDNDNVSEVRLFFGHCPFPGVGCTGAGEVLTGGPATPGCGNFMTTLATPLVVDNQDAPVYLEIATGPSTATTFSAVKLYYRLRVSPSPAVATFPNDVPTGHPFFRFVEALAAAGITAGCGPGAFCPAQPVTRGEMAVFLAAALGLHFPN